MPKDKKSCESGDRISTLPDSIIHHILSFLPTKYAVATTVLSSRWNYLWTAVPVLDFDQNLLYSNIPLKNNSSFMNFVDRVLHLHYGSNISTFCLSCKDPDINRVNSWITTVTMRCKVQELNLNISDFDDPIVLPRSLFTCESITTLKINMESVLKLPSLIHFEQLKVLHLSLVDFSSDYLTDRVVFDFPSLEDFFVENFDMMSIKTLTISAPKLKRLTINDGLWHRMDFAIEIYAKSLEFLSITSDLSCEYTLYSLSSLVSASVDLCDCIMTNPVTKFLTAISNVKDLIVTMTAELYQALHEAGHSAFLPTLPYVINLEVSSRPVNFHINDFYHFHFSGLITLLHITPNVESLLITNGCTHEEDDWTVTTMPTCFQSHLKSIEIDDFNGSAKEIHLVNFFLKNVRCLEKITIFASTDLSADPDNKVEVTKQLLLLPRGSPYCTIDFS